MDTKNVIAAISLSAAVIIIYALFFGPSPEEIKQNKIKRRLRNVMNEAVKKISLNFNYSYLVIAKITMLNNKYAIIKETLFADFKRIK